MRSIERMPVANQYRRLRLPSTNRDYSDQSTGTPQRSKTGPQLHAMVISSDWRRLKPCLKSFSAWLASPVSSSQFVRSGKLLDKREKCVISDSTLITLRCVQRAKILTVSIVARGIVS
jgi:hypothetical protein